jgi:hypothetical protein
VTRRQAVASPLRRNIRRRRIDRWLESANAG